MIDLARRTDDMRAWAFYALIAVSSMQLDCRLRELRDELREVRHALPERPAAYRPGVAP